MRHIPLPLPNGLMSSGLMVCFKLSLGLVTC